MPVCRWLAPLAASLLFAAAPAGAQETQARQAGVRYESRVHNVPKRWEAQVRYPVFTGGSPVQRAASAAFRRDALSRLADFERESREDQAQDWANGAPRNPYSFEIQPTVSLVRPELVSGYFTVYAYSGGAHPNTLLPARSFGVIGGKARALALKDLLAPGVRAADLVKTVVLPALNAAKKARGVDPVDTLDPKRAENFVLTPNGITWLFEPYSVGAYVEGSYPVKVSYRNLTKWLDPNGLLKPLLAK